MKNSESASDIEQKTDLNYFRSLLGDDYVIRPDTPRIEDYLKDMADYASQPLLVLQPKSAFEVSKIVSHARNTRTPIVARGAGTSLTGATSAHRGLVIDFSKRMKRVLEIDTVNRYVHCEPGIAIDDLNAELAKKGFFFPPDPSSAPWCTIGGAIAENSGGMKCFHYGTVKDWVLALKVVLSDGSIVTLGEPLPKNRVGYDLVHLICGSEGTLAIIVEAWLKILPIESKSKHDSFLVFFDSWESAGRAIESLRASRAEPLLIEFLDRDSINAVNSSFDSEIPENEATLFFESPWEESGEILKLCRDSGSIGTYIAKDEKDGERLYNARALIYLAVKALQSGAHTEDVVVPIKKLPEYLALVRGIASKYDLKIPTAGHAGDGNVHPVILFDKDSKESVEKAENAFAEICRYAIDVGGSVTGEHGIGEQKIEFVNEQLSKHGGEALPPLMQGIKKLWDPDNILNPGKFLKMAQTGEL